MTRAYHIYEYNNDTVVLQDVDTLALIELSYDAVDSMLHLIEQ